MEQPIRRRRRPALSCLECRRRKIRCDRNDPCGHCVVSRNQCTYRLFNAASRNRESSGSPRRDRESESLPTQPASPATTGRGRSDALQIPGGASDPTPSEGVTLILRDMVMRVQRLEQSIASNSNTASRSPSTNDILSRTSGARESQTQVVLKKARMWRWSDWMGEAPEVG